MNSSDLELHLEKELEDAGETDYVRELRFHPVRRFRFDFAWPNRLLAAEVDGGTFNFGRHNRPGGFAKDCEKGNLAILNGWRVLHFDATMVTDGTALSTIQDALLLFPVLDEDDEDLAA